MIADCFLAVPLHVATKADVSSLMVSSSRCSHREGLSLVSTPTAAEIGRWIESHEVSGLVTCSPWCDYVTWIVKVPEKARHGVRTFI